MNGRKGHGRRWPRLLGIAQLSWALAIAAASGCRTSTLDQPSPSEIETTLFLIGDAGEPNPRAVGAPLDSLTVQASVAPERSVIVFLGDNVYPDGIPEAGGAEWADARRRLEAQVLAVPQGARGIFVPGNHDWASQTAFGLYAVRLQEQLIVSLASGRDVRMLPGNGCPGPVALDIGRLRLIVLDTQWWLHDFIVRDSATRCPTEIGAFMTALRGQLRPEREAGGGDRVALVAGHHPLMTGGEHGGYCGVTSPLHRFGRRSQDVISRLNRIMRDSLESAFAAHAPLAYAAGHDHNQQVLRSGRRGQYLLVSGAGSPQKVSCAVRLRESHFTSQHRSGFMRLDIMRGRGVLLRVFHYRGSGAGGLAYSRWLEQR